MGQVWRKDYRTHNVLCSQIRGSKYCSAVLHHTATHYVKYGKTKVIYDFSNDSLLRNFRALIVMLRHLKFKFLFTQLALQQWQFYSNTKSE